MSVQEADVKLCVSVLVAQRTCPIFPPTAASQVGLAPVPFVVKT
jgi:hypothetical protein